jgi:hypothetical protein
MRCPHCGADVTPAPFCTRCGGALTAAAPLAQDATTIPLTDEQRTALKLNTTLPILILVPTLGVVLLMASCVLGRFLDSPFVKGFAAIAGVLLLVVIAFVAIHVRSHRADLRAGVTQVRVARLIRKRATSQSPRSFYAEFEQIGSVTVMYDLYQRLVEGDLYRVTYSQHTRRGWSIDPL